MRNGFRSSRGAILGTIGGAAGFTTVAIGVGPFFCSWFTRFDPNTKSFVSLLSCPGPTANQKSVGVKHSPLAAPWSFGIWRGTLANRNAALLRSPLAATPTLRPCAYRKPDPSRAVCALRPTPGLDALERVREVSPLG